MPGKEQCPNMTDGQWVWKIMYQSDPYDNRKYLIASQEIYKTRLRHLVGKTIFNTYDEAIEEIDGINKTRNQWGCD